MESYYEEPDSDSLETNEDMDAWEEGFMIGEKDGSTYKKEDVA